MESSITHKQEGTDQNIVEEIHQITQIPLSEEPETCHVCGTDLRDGARCTAFAVRVPDQPTVQIAHLKCADCQHEPTEHLTLDAHELILDGRIGTCTDQTTQSSWPALLAIQPRAVSSADTTELNILPGTTVVRKPIASSDHYMADDDATERHPWQRAVVRADRGARDHPSTDADAESTCTDVGHDTSHVKDGRGPHQ